MTGELQKPPQPDLELESEQEQRALAAKIVNDCLTLHYAFVEVEVLAEYDLTGFVGEKVIGEDLVFKEIGEDVKFSLTKILMAIIAGDFIENDKNRMKAYYAHYDNKNNLRGVTVFTMSVDDAVAILKICIQEFNISEEYLQDALFAVTANRAIWVRKGEDPDEPREVTEALANKLE